MVVYPPAELASFQARHAVDMHTQNRERKGIVNSRFGSRPCTPMIKELAGTDQQYGEETDRRYSAGPKRCRDVEGPLTRETLCRVCLEDTEEATQ